MKIYEIMKEIDECIDYENGEVINFERLQELMIAKSEKIDNIACLYKNLSAEADAIDSEIERLTERRKSAVNRAESIKEFLTFILHGEKYTSPRNKITILRQGCQTNGITVIRGNISRDHVHMMLSCPPTIAPSKIMQLLKGRSSKILQEEFEELRRRYRA